MTYKEKGVAGVRLLRSDFIEEGRKCYARSSTMNRMVAALLDAENAVKDMAMENGTGAEMHVERTSRGVRLHALRAGTAVVEYGGPCICIYKQHEFGTITRTAETILAEYVRAVAWKEEEA